MKKHSSWISALMAAVLTLVLAVSWSQPAQASGTLKIGMEANYAPYNWTQTTSANGAVKIDGHDIRDVKIDSLRKQMSVMMQESFIFSGTIMDNIRYGRLDATDEEVIEAAKAVHAHDFIMEMEKGYQTEVNERGSSLSTGQRQLISFARALLNDPKILILDEATSSIDTHIELLIQDALEVLLRGRTSFVIAHRLSTIRNADCIMVMRDGKIAERGNHDELIKIENGQYKELCDAQYRFLMEDANKAV